MTRASRCLVSEIALLIGIPWREGAEGPDAYDCWAAADMVQRRLFGRGLPGLGPDRRRTITGARQRWRRAPAPRDGDLVEMRRMGRANHIGVWIAGRILHCQRGAGMVYDRPDDIRVMGWQLRFWTPTRKATRPRGAADAPAIPAIYVPGLDLMLDPGIPAETLLAAHRAVPIEAHAGESLRRIITRAGLASECIAVFARPVGAADDIRLPDAADADALEALLHDLGAVRPEDWETRRLAPGERLVITQVPQDGGGGSNPLRIILSIAVIAAAAFIAGPAGLGLGATLGSSLGIGAAAGGQLVFGLVNALGQFVISQILPPPSPRGVSGFTDEVSPTFTARAQPSVARPGAPIPVQFGRHIHQLDDVTPPFARFENNTQVICQLMAVGIGEHVIEEVLLGDTSVWRDGAPTGNLPGVSIEHVLSGQAVTLFEEAVFSQGDVTGLTLEPSQTVGWHSAIPQGRAIEAIEIDIGFQQLVRIDSNGANQSRTVEIRVEAQMIDDDDQPLAEVQILETLSFTAATRSSLRSSHKWFVPGGRYRLRLTRLTAAGDGNTFDTAFWTGLKGIMPGGRTYQGLELLAVKVAVGEIFAAQSARQVRVVKTRKLPVWDGSGWSAPQPTREIAWAVAEILRMHGRLGDIDMDELLALHATWSARGDRFDTIFDQGMSFWEALQAALRAGRAQPDQLGRRIRLWRDEPQAVPRQLFSERNIRRGSLTISPRLAVSERPERLIAQYMDERTWRPSELPVGPITGRERRERYFGITARTHLAREVSHDIRASQFRSVSVSFETELENRLLRRGDVIVLSHAELTGGVAVGVDAWQGLAITLSRDLDFGALPANLLMTFSGPDGTVFGPVQVLAPTGAGRSAGLTLTAEEMDRIIADYGSDPRDWVARTRARDESIRAVIGEPATAPMRLIVESVGEERGGYSPVTCIDDDPRAHDEATAGLASLEGAITAIAASVMAGTLRIDLALAPSLPAGATFVHEYSVDGGLSWLPLGSGSEASFEVAAPAGVTEVRSAVILGGRGPWVTAAISVSLLPAPGNLAEVTPGRFAAEGRLDIAADPVAGAQSYRFSLRNAAGNLMAQLVRATPALDLDAAALAQLGALLRDLSVDAAALEQGAQGGALSTLAFNVPAPVPVTGIVQFGNGLHVWSVPDPAPPLGWRVRWQANQVGGFTGSQDVTTAQWSRGAVGWPNLVWFAGRDAFGIGPETHIDYTPPPSNEGPGG
ncbi:hypothetical protein SAMN05443999_101261 [Roseovarius azorensis]|uniref:NlpC/P60 domain-containing protein n=1 Tax=Roseovarius azorensis TaxID=1287727 RepID=A0A1H7GEJ1_9RHOB|nr:host specificity factor TipJ family phage tail protein [Roseovarius azorensis]SEK34900.1 hypothetical protein SAMN05443999_101261 [Roseovarius azorensis]